MVPGQHSRQRFGLGRFPNAFLDEKFVESCPRSLTWPSAASSAEPA
jgi:hypothetical protein